MSIHTLLNPIIWGCIVQFNDGTLSTRSKEGTEAVVGDSGSRKGECSDFFLLDFHLCFWMNITDSLNINISSDTDKVSRLWALSRRRGLKYRLMRRHIMQRFGWCRQSKQWFWWADGLIKRIQMLRLEVEARMFPPQECSKCPLKRHSKKVLMFRSPKGFVATRIRGTV